MTIDDQIRDEKLQYDISRKAAEISALSSGKIDKYEYLTGKEILPSNQQQIIEQAKFTYSPLGKAFAKQTKTTEDQGKKKIKAIQNERQAKTIKKRTYDNKDTPLFSKQKEMFDILVDEGLEEMVSLNEKAVRDYLIYQYKANTADEKFDKFDNALSFLNKIRDGKISQTDAKSDQEDFKSDLGEIKKENNMKRSKEQKYSLYNNEMLS